MGRRTAWWRAAVVGAVLGAVAGAPGIPAVAASGTPSPSTSFSSSPSSSATASSYAFAEGAPSVTGAVSTADAELLEPGTTYRSSLPSVGKVRYRLELDSTSTVYVAATAVPPTDAVVTATEGVRVSVQDADGHSCSAPDTATIGAGRSPRPLTAWGARVLPSDRSLCQGSGTYYVVVERVLRTESSPDTWGLELSPVREPRLRQAGSTSAPEAWDSATPHLPVARPHSSGAVRASVRRPGWSRGSGGMTYGRGRRCSTRCRSTGDSSCTPPPT